MPVNVGRGKCRQAIDVRGATSVPHSSVRAAAGRERIGGDGGSVGDAHQETLWAPGLAVDLDGEVKVGAGAVASGTCCS